MAPENEFSGFSDSTINEMHSFLLLKNELLKQELEKIVNVISDKRSIPALINLLDDNEFDVRWIAAECLIRIGRRSIVPLINSIREGRSSCFPGRGAYHVLQCLMTKKEKKIFDALMLPVTGQGNQSGEALKDLFMSNN